MPDQDSILLQTKLHRPPITRDLVVRARLLEQLDSGINYPLTLVCAPAGFGKTTLVCTWLERRAIDRYSAAADLPAIWLSLDKNDSDLNLFLRYFIAALRTIFDQACAETLALLQVQQRSPQADFYATFSNELDQLPGEAIIVLDDFHFIRGKAVFGLLNELARHWPKSLHLVLISRIDPPIPLTSLRAKGVLHEIRTQDLRFTTEETALYLSKTQPDILSQIALPLLEEHFEGWPAGLHLAILSLRSAGDQEAVLSALSKENPNITGYLIDEVLVHLVPAIQTFLLKTSILDRFCASLCETVIGAIDPTWSARLCLDWIERSELFITPLDDRREWYRYHHLFQDFLQRRASIELRPDQITNVHRRASIWFEEQGLLDEALQHALAAGDIDLAARQMIAGLCDVLNRGDRPTLERWLSLLPEEMIRGRPELLMIKACVLHFSWQFDLLAQVLSRIEELLDTNEGDSLAANELQILRGQIFALRAQQAYFNNQTTQAIDLSRQALALLPPEWTFLRGGAMFYLSMSMLANGQALAAEQLLLNEYESCVNKTDAYAMRLLLSLCFNYFNTGQLEQTRQLAQVIHQGTTQRELTVMKSWGDYFLGVVSFQRSDLEAAAEYFTRIVENRYTAVLTTWRDAAAGLALIHQIQGKHSEAWRMVESISQFDLEQRGSEDNRTRSLHARLMLLQGDLESAGRWVDSFTDLPPDQALMWLEEPQVTRVRILVARGADADLRLARQILDTLDEIADRTHNTRYKIEILALRAVVLDTLEQAALGKTGSADLELEQALGLTRLGDFIRVFVDLGKPMQAMLNRLAKQGHLAETIRRILAAFPPEYSPPKADNKPVSQASQAIPDRFPSHPISTLVEPLTPRELEVLTLLRGSTSIKEIALKLNISYATARRHTINIYAKLKVNRRLDAVARAEELNILPPR